MIITKTPFRMSFFGGGTDIPEFFEEHGGSVISTTFDKYCYVTVRHLPPFFDYANEVVYSKIERVKDPSEIKHPAVREAMRYLNMRDLRLSYEADLPARSGLGTSSSFAVGMLNAFHCLKGTYASKERLAKEAIHLERDLCAEAGGWQDQIAAAYGGLNRIDFSQDGFDVRPIVISKERKQELCDSLLMFFTGFTRFSSDMQKQNKVADKTQRLLEMLALVDEAQAVLCDKSAPLSRFGELLDVTWKLKRGTGSAISTSAIDELYARGMNAGARGGKLLGAGGGGFLVFFVEPDARESVMAAMSDLLYIPFQFEDGGAGVVYYDPEDYDLGEEED
jgi:D-glycero-alpha-D-manno-heptose-7-phosphate kinase